MQKYTAITGYTIILLVALAATTLFLSYAVFLQLFIAFALAYILNPAVEYLERKGIGRIAGIMAVFLSLIHI